MARDTTTAGRWTCGVLFCMFVAGGSLALALLLRQRRKVKGWIRLGSAKKWQIAPGRISSPPRWAWIAPRASGRPFMLALVGCCAFIAGGNLLAALWLDGPWLVGMWTTDVVHLEPRDWGWLDSVLLAASAVGLGLLLAELPRQLVLWWRVRSLLGPARRWSLATATVIPHTAGSYRAAPATAESSPAADAPDEVELSFAAEDAARQLVLSVQKDDPPLEIGDEVSLLYDPNKPTDAKPVRSFAGVWVRRRPR